MEPIEWGLGNTATEAVTDLYFHVLVTIIGGATLARLSTDAGTGISHLLQLLDHLIWLLLARVDDRSSFASALEDAFLLEFLLSECRLDQLHFVLSVVCQWIDR